EDDQPVARGLDHLVEHLEPVGLPQTELRQLRLDQGLRRVLERLLHLADADHPQPLAGVAGEGDRVLDGQAGEEVGLAGAAAAVGALVARRRQQRLEYGRRVDLQGAHSALTMRRSMRVTVWTGPPPGPVCSMATLSP